jgi:hypothetical protein
MVIELAAGSVADIAVPLRLKTKSPVLPGASPEEYLAVLIMSRAVLAAAWLDVVKPANVNVTVAVRVVELYATPYVKLAMPVAVVDDAEFCVREIVPTDCVAVFQLPENVITSPATTLEAVKMTVWLAVLLQSV